MWFNLLLIVAPLMGLAQWFGSSVTPTYWIVLGVLALAAAILGRNYPLSRVHPLVWHRKPWTFLISSFVTWILLQVVPIVGSESTTLGYRLASLVVALWLVLVTTPGGDGAPIYGRHDR